MRQRAQGSAAAQAAHGSRPRSRSCGFSRSCRGHQVFEQGTRSESCAPKVQGPGQARVDQKSPAFRLFFRAMTPTRSAYLNKIIPDSYWQGNKRVDRHVDAVIIARGPAQGRPNPPGEDAHRGRHGATARPALRPLAARLTHPNARGAPARPGLASGSTWPRRPRKGDGLAFGPTSDFA